MPECVESNSKMYIEENDCVLKFVQENIFPCEGAHFTLKDAKDAYKRCEHFNGKVLTLKNDLMKCLKTWCFDIKRVEGIVKRNVFEGYKLVEGGMDP
jgi:hypothetical protein